MIKSSWKLTFDPSGTPAVLLAIGDLIASQIEWASRRGSEVITLVDSPVPFLRDGKNTSLQIGFDKLVIGSVRSDILKGVIRGAMEHSAFGKKQLKIEAEGIVEAYWLASAALIPEVVPRLQVAGRTGVFTRYQILLSGISEVATGIPPLVPTPYSPTDPGGFAGLGYDPEDPGTFDGASPSATAPGTFANAIPSPTNPGSPNPEQPGTIPWETLGDFWEEIG